MLYTFRLYYSLICSIPFIALFLCSLNNDIFCVFRIRFNFKPRAAEMTFHSKRPYRSRIIVSYTFLFCVKTNALADVVVARRTPYIERKLESDDKDPLIELMCPTAQGMGPCHFVDVGLAIVVWRVVFVEGLHLVR